MELVAGDGVGTGDMPLLSMQLVVGSAALVVVFSIELVTDDGVGTGGMPLLSSMKLVAGSAALVVVLVSTAAAVNFNVRTVFILVKRRISRRVRGEGDCDVCCGCAGVGVRGSLLFVVEPAVFAVAVTPLFDRGVDGDGRGVVAGDGVVGSRS